MLCQAAFDQWQTTLMPHLSHVSKPQAPVLALGSFGMGLARSCALSAVSHLLAQGMHRKEQTVRQQWRAWYDEVPRQRGTMLDCARLPNSRQRLCPRGSASSKRRRRAAPLSTLPDRRGPAKGSTRWSPLAAA